MADIDYLGTTPLFVGVESQYWSLAQFQNAAARAKALGISSLLVKVADGGNYWYQSIGGWQGVLAAVKAAGIKAVPYTYCYGDADGGLQSEIAVLTTVMKQVGIVIADMEVEYNGHPEWARAVSDALKPVPGTFGVCTWADPNLQDWQSVLAALAPCVNFWLPQVYSDYLAGVYKAQYAGYGPPIYPIFDLAGDFGPNNIIAHVRAAQSPIIALWEYQELASVAASLSTVLQFGGTTPMPKPTTPSQNQVTAAQQEWESTASSFPGSVSPSYTTGIANAWEERYYRGQQIGGPTSGEETTDRNGKDRIDWGGNPIIVQYFRYGHAEWNSKTSSCRFFDGRGEIL